jgi:hypothetical protein
MESVDGKMLWVIDFGCGKNYAGLSIILGAGY